MINFEEQIDKTTQDFIETFGELSNKEINWKPDAETWSIAQNIDHLIVINETYFPLIDALKKGTYKLPFVAKIGFLVSFFGNFILKAAQPDRKNKMKTFSIWEPSKSNIPDGLLDKFKNHQLELKKIIKDSEELVNHGTIISSPSNKYIVYKLEKAFEIIVSHEQRHFEQAKEILNLLKQETSIK